MKNNSSIMTFLTFMFIGIVISVSSNNWLGCWMGIEINLISFLPIMMNSVSVYSSESLIKYYIIQSMSSSLFFMSIMCIIMYNVDFLMMISLLMKMGCAPFHLWFPSVMEGLSWYNCFMLSIIQKLAPMILLSYLYVNMSLFIIISCLWGSVGGLGYSSLRKIISYSSIYNLGWIISGISMLNYSWIIYYLFYSMTLMMICYLFNVLGLNYLNQLFLMPTEYMKTLLLMVVFMSMGGFPPFFGFFPKMIVVNCLMAYNIIFICLFLMLSSLLVMFFYLRIIFTGLMICSVSIKYINYTFDSLFYMFGLISLFGFLIIYMLMLYF